MNGTRTTLAALAAAAVTVLALAASANAATFCVNDPACPAGGVPKGTPEAAVTAANADAAFDTIRIGPGTYNTVALWPSQPVAIVGAGRDATKIVMTGPGPALMAAGSSSSVSKLSVRLTQSSSQGVALDDGADATDVSVTAPDPLTQLVGFMTWDPGTDLNHVSVDLGDGDFVTGIGGAGGGVVRDSTVTASTGITGGQNGLTVRRTAVHAQLGLSIAGGAFNASNVLITPHPRPDSFGFVGVDVTNSQGGLDGSLLASNLTIDGGGLPSGYGVFVHSIFNPNVTTGTASATVTGAILRGLAHPLAQLGDSGIETATLGITYSSYDAASVQENGYGGFFHGVGNHEDNPDPRFVNRAAGDYRLRWDSPLLDQGRPTALVPEENPDLAGHERVRDSDGNGSAIRDIGAYEYQRLAPTAALAIDPAQALLGSATSFDASQSSDPDGDPLTYAWAFGDGATGTGAQATHAFGAPGSYAATVQVTDPTGLNAVAGGTASVAAAQPSPGGPAGDHVAPVLSALSLSPKLFTARKGSRVTYRLSEQARLTLVLQRAARRNGHTVFTRYARASRAGTAGVNRMMLRRRLGARRLAPGRYRLTLVARDAAANRSNAVSTKFTVKR
jgi:hypothetical protein